MQNLITNIRRLVISQTAQFPLAVCALLFISGILFWGAFNWSLELSNTESFCISCHEMSSNIYPEYKASVHYKNTSGVRATCPDCHVPKVWLNKVIRKVGATNELFHWMAGSIDTREKFLQKRLILAGYVWSAMEANDSLECRNCHELTYMNKLGRNTVRAHGRAAKEDLTCIDCHKGIAHELPEIYIEKEHNRFERENTNCGNCHVNLDYGDDENWD
jgi:cytochrome c-type protein NapC